MSTPDEQKSENAVTDRLILNSSFDRYLFGFNKYLFSENANQEFNWGGAEEALYHQVSARIAQQDSLSKCIPSPPTELIALMQELESEETNFDKIHNMIRENAGLIGEVVKVSNSPLYRPRSGEITSIEKAISMLGLEGIMKVASAIMMRNIVNVESKEFRLPFKKIWAHCLKSAESCQLIGNPSQSFQYYLLGLIHDIGRIAVFSIFLAETKGKDLANTGVLAVVTKLMEKNAPWLSTLVAGEWGLNSFYLITFGEFEKLCLGKMDEQDYQYRTAETKALELGTMCAMIHTLSSNDWIGRGDGIAVLEQAGLELKLIDILFTRFDLADATVI